MKLCVINICVCVCVCIYILNIDTGIFLAPVVKNPPANAGDIRDTGLIPGLGRSPGGGNDNPLQYSCLENPRQEEEEPCWLQSTGLRRVRQDQGALHTCSMHLSKGFRMYSGLIS